MKLKWKITLPLLLLLLLLTAMTTGINYYMTKASAEKSVSNILDSNLESLIGQIDRAVLTEKIVIDEITDKNVTLVRVFSEILKVNSDIGVLDLKDVEFFKFIANLLGVTELNVANQNGVIVGSNIAENYGYSFDLTAETSRYLQIISDSSLVIVEEPRQSANSNNMYQYMGVSRADARGFVQVGFDAHAVKEFQEHLDIIHTASAMRIGTNGSAAILRNGEVVYMANNSRIGQNVSSEAWYRQVSSGRGKAWININGQEMYAGFANTGGMTLLVLFPKAEYNELLSSVVSVSIASLAIAALISILIYFIVSRALSPLIPMTAFMTKAGTTGDLVLMPEDIAVISKLAESKDELGQCIGASAKFVGRVTEVSEFLETVSSGDLTSTIAPLSEKDTLGICLESMNEKLNLMFGEINHSTQQVSQGARQIANGAQTLAQGSTEQAASIQELSNSISEIAKKTRENADVAMQTAELADAIKMSAERGTFQMDEMISAVKEITEASNSISKVIKVIDDIAFQTNILALNAAVEAARAGVHGKGFAVVAEEVRNLAAKSAEAAKETGMMIQDSMDKAEVGAKIAEETAASLTEIVTGINESSMMIFGIASSSENQSMEIMHINEGIDQVTQVVSQNSATAEESAAASEEMSSQSMVLQELISQFKLKSMGFLPDSSNASYGSDEQTKYRELSSPGAGFGKY
ncbi:MAG: methyl-accepting chemotaxis protein [Oscillospiraceae bacterium]|nr:methyl-accepting chemotaxis protein [Oscillospiraceae bacterium]